MRFALARHLLSIAALPFVMTVVVPVMIARAYGVDIDFRHVGLLPGIGGAKLIAVGLFFFAWSLRQFATVGKGTLAPWDPPRHLVVEGPYRYVRNPMISGVVIMLFGEAALWSSLPHLAWAATFFAINLIFIPLMEEPMLRVKFGETYDEYRRNVPGLIPRLTPYGPKTP